MFINVPDSPQDGVDDSSFVHRKAVQQHLPQRSTTLTEAQQLVAAAGEAIRYSDMRTLRDLVESSKFPKTFMGKVVVPAGPAPASRSSLMHYAAMLGNAEAIHVLVAAGVPVGTADSHGDTPFFLALQRCPQALRVMITQGRDRNLRYVHPRLGRNFLFELVTSPVRPHEGFRRLPLIEYMIVDYGLGPKDRDGAGMSLLEHAQSNYLQLGSEADQVIAYLENPPRGKSSMAAVHGRACWEFAKHPITRVAFWFIFAGIHVAMYLLDVHARGTERPVNATANVWRYHTEHQVNEYVPFVAAGRHNDTAALPFFLDVVDHVFFGWEPETSLIAAKFLSIFLGAIVGFVVFVTVVHFALRDVLGFRMFGAEPTGDGSCCGGGAAEDEPDEAFDDMAEGVTPRGVADASFMTNPMEDDPASRLYLDADEADDAGDGHGGSPKNDEPAPRPNPQQDGPALPMIRGRGRFVLGFYGTMVGIYCGGLVYNAMLTSPLFGYDVDSPRYQDLRMSPGIVMSNGRAVTKDGLLFFFFFITSLLSPFLLVLAFDTMGQALAMRIFVPSTWYSRFGHSSWQVMWPSLRVPITMATLIVFWAAVSFIFFQEGILFYWSDTSRTLFATPHVAVNIFLGGIALLVDVAFLLQDWSMPDLQSLVVVAGKKEARTDAHDGDARAQSSAVNVGSGDTEHARQERKKQLIAGFKKRGGDTKKKAATGKNRDKQRTMLGGAKPQQELTVLHARNAFKVPGIWMCGNVHWLLWFTTSWVMAMDLHYLLKYIGDAVWDDAPYPSWRSAANQTNIFEHVHADDGRDVALFAVALLPTFIAAVVLLITMVRSTTWSACCCTENAVMPVPALDERDEVVVPTTARSGRGSRFVVAGAPTASEADELRIPLGAGAYVDHDEDAPGNSLYDDQRTAPADVWASAYRDDVMKLGSIIDQDDSLLDARGGIGIKIISRAADGVTSSMAQRHVRMMNTSDPAYAATPLHYAVMANSRAAVSALLTRGANTRLRTISGMCTAWELAQLLHYEGLAQLLAQH